MQSKTTTPKPKEPSDAIKLAVPTDANSEGGSNEVTALEKSPLEVTMKAGKLIVSVVEDMKKESPQIALAKNQLASQKQQKSIELFTKSGSLLVHATTKGDKLDNIVLEQITKKNEAKSKAAVSDGTTAPASTSTKQQAKRERVDFSRSSLERNFITPARAISDFLLKMSDLESLPKTKRRSPYEQEPPIIVYWRKDVEAKAIEVWGSRENLLRECLKREIERKQHQQSSLLFFTFVPNGLFFNFSYILTDIFTVKRRLRDYRREMNQGTTVSMETGLGGRSGRVVVTAIVM